jgi:anthranilate/para-aminobenzoate synthase component I
VLVRDLVPTTGQPDVVLAPYECRGRDAPRWAGDVTHVGELEVDVAPCAVTPKLDEEGHAEAVETIRDLIAAGDVYQVNMTLRARLPDVEGAALLAATCAQGVAPYAAWVRLPGREVVSASPELLFSVDGDRVTCQPMKGTAPQGKSDVLERSGKDWSELAMITDLVRNDLTPLCQPRSVRVACARRLVPLPYAVQAVSDVEGRLLPGTTPLEVLEGVHPGGSVTGAPKGAAMEVIRGLERSPRGAYCGALGLVEGDRAVFSLLIRTAERCEGGWLYGVGGGVVYDSDPGRELDEVRVKLGALGRP